MDSAHGITNYRDGDAFRLNQLQTKTKELQTVWKAAQSASSSQATLTPAKKGGAKLISPALALLEAIQGLLKALTTSIQSNQNANLSSQLCKAVEQANTLLSTELDPKRVNPESLSALTQALERAADYLNSNKNDSTEEKQLIEQLNAALLACTPTPTVSGKVVLVQKGPLSSDKASAPVFGRSGPEYNETPFENEKHSYALLLILAAVVGLGALTVGLIGIDAPRLLDLMNQAGSIGVGIAGTTAWAALTFPLAIYLARQEDFKSDKAGVKLRERKEVHSTGRSLVTGAVLVVAFSAISMGIIAFSGQGALSNMPHWIRMLTGYVGTVGGGLLLGVVYAENMHERWVTDTYRIRE